MKLKKAVKDTVAAENKSIGFDFQYYYYLYQLLRVKHDERVGLEVKDDVHVEFPNGSQALIQLKHTVTKSSNGKPANLTTKDIDLWKTISNWCKMICDPGDDRANKKNQKTFLEKTQFVLASNKSDNAKNAFISNLKRFQRNDIKIQELRSIVEKLQESTKDSEVKQYVSDLLSLPVDILTLFLSKISFELDVGDIIAQCKLAIKDCKVPENRIDDVFKSIDSQIREDNFYSIQRGIKISVSGAEFYKRYRKHFDKGFNANLLIRKYEITLPDKIEDQVFIKQLIDIEDIQPDEIELIAEFTTHKLQLQNNIEQWIQEGELTQSEKSEFMKDAILQWRNIFRSKHRAQPTPDEINQKALEILDLLRDKKLSLSGAELTTELSNGEFYHLSDQPLIGWRFDWREKYENGKTSI